MSKTEVTVTPRTVYERNGKRPRKVYDADGITADGIEYHVYGTTAADAKRKALRAVDFIRANPAVEIGSFALRAIDCNRFVLRLPSGCTTTFIARSIDAALARAACEYSDHAAVINFVREALRMQEETLP